MKRRTRAFFGVLSLSVVGTLGLVYVGGNLLLPQLAVVVYDLELELEVVADDNGAPVSGARVSWLWRSVGEPRLLGVTDDAGRMRKRHGFGVQPRWVWPSVGEFSFAGRALHIEADGFGDWHAELADLLPRVPLRAPQAKLRIELTRR